MSFADRVREAADRNESKVVLSLDLWEKSSKETSRKGRAILRRLAGHLCAVKIGWPLLLRLGSAREVVKLVSEAHRFGLPIIMDAKLSDVAHTNARICEICYNWGIDAIIANPVVGWQDGLDAVFHMSRRRQRGVIIVVYMSHTGAREIFTVNLSRSRPMPLYLHLAKLSRKWRASGVVVGGTFPEVISRVRPVVGPRIPIFCPGIGAQGGDAVAAVMSGADYLIIGRYLVENPRPQKVLERINRKLSKMANFERISE